MTTVQHFKSTPWVERRAENSWRVRWRLLSGESQGIGGFKTEKQAKQFVVALETYGPDEALKTLRAFRDRQKAAAQSAKEHAALKPLVSTTDGEPEPMTVKWVVEQWLDRNDDANDATKKRDRQRARDYIYGPLGDRLAAELTATEVQQWMSKLDRARDDEGNLLHAFKHKKNIHSVLASAFNFAVKVDDIPILRNPAKGITPKDEKETRAPIALTMSELERLLALVPEPWRIYVTFFASTGMRSQEINAMRVRQLDFETDIIRVTRAVKYTAGMGYKEGATKTKGSKRDLPIPENCRDALYDLCRDRKPEDYVFVNTRGGPIKYANFHDTLWTPLIHEFAGDTKRIVKPPRGRSRIEWIRDGKGRRPTPHDLRHTFATMAVNQNIPLPVVQRQLGHASITTTVNTYSHIRPAEHQVLAQVITHRSHLTTDGEQHELAPE